MKPRVPGSLPVDGSRLSRYRNLCGAFRLTRSRFRSTSGGHTEDA